MIKAPNPIVRRWLFLFGVGLTIATGKPAAPAKLLVTHALLFTLAPGQETPFQGYFTVLADGTIGSVAAGDPAPDISSAETFNAQGHWVLPGFISAHSHLWQSAYRGLAADQTLMGWIQAVYLQNAVNAEAANFYWFTLHGALDHLRNGITGVYNFNYAAHDRPGNFDEEQFRAEAESGVRFVHGINIDRVNTTHSLADARENLRRFLGWTKAQPPVPGFLRVMINGAGAFVPTHEQADAEAVLGREFDLGNQSHFLENPSGQEAERSKFRWFIDSGLISPKLIFGHFIHTDSWIIAETARGGAAMSWNPLSNGRLASGVADIPAYLKAGIRVGMGVDGQASADRADPFENMRMGLYQVRAKYQDAHVLSPLDVVRLHTLGSADVIGAADRLGSLVAGKLADFIVVDPTNLGPIFDPYASLVFIASVKELERVYIGGKLRVLRGELVDLDFNKISAEVFARVKVPPSPVR